MHEIIEQMDKTIIFLWFFICFGNAVCVAERLKFEESKSQSTGIHFVKIPAGEFNFGTIEEPEKLAMYYKKYDKDIKKEWFEETCPAKSVKIEKPLYIGKTEITRGQFAKFVKETNYETTAETGDYEGKNKGSRRVGTDGLIEKNLDPNANWKNPGFPQEDTHPVVNVSWHDANAFCNWLSEEDGKRYRLPTEAEWEYAAKAGTATRYWFGDDAEALAQYDNVTDAAGQERYVETWEETAVKTNDRYVFTSPVEMMRENPWGLYGMNGNVAEWCNDDYNSGKPQKNVRGGSWYYGPSRARSASRGRALPSGSACYVGFRIVLEIDD